ncbi:MAG: hypothetical protein A2Z64_05230 [Betaproteobacteria bacterium RIFCSPLOWO2_02_67_12]|nr:MAG: hypothetical protein A2Z64_05230 [Betaproteobacteria bacterium RIFCSPLOWO2_02_67_12]OGA31231.1 MAG: hypothetical protein A3I65_04630 [Betaproteobacteria bacterium RIFCSPLOWO2_02_FULL_68_150]OGA66895.1 MAG: hypothetical protein A3F77_01130 [Betaproteobacteria bacterium RIFCSPLOWO2_12_FULL_67_28]
MASEYEAFVRDRAKILSGKELVLTLRDLAPGRKKYRGVNVRCVVSRPPRPGEPVLWIRSVVGLRDPEPYSVRIVEQLPETFQATPYSDFFDAMERAERR